GVTSAWRDFDAAYPGQLTYLGGPASATHSADCHRSSHNRASTCGGQESPMVNPATGQLESYDGGTCAAIHPGHGGNRPPARQLRNQFLMGRRRNDVRYVIDDGTGYYPDGTTFRSSGHGTHTHTSLTPWGQRSGEAWIQKHMTDADRARILRQA